MSFCRVCLKHMDDEPQPIPWGICGTCENDSYPAADLSKHEDREKYRAATKRELHAIRNGSWPRNLNDRCRYGRADPKHIERVLVQSLAYLDNIPVRVWDGELEGWEP